jgi:subtilisin family serine protease
MMKELEVRQEVVIQRIEEKVLEGKEMEISYSYTWLFNGVAARIPYSAMKSIAAMEGVKQVIVQPVYELHENTNASKDASLHTVSDGAMVGREDTWALGYTGQGMKIAIIDTGLDVDHPNFAALPAEKLNENSVTKESLAGLLGSLNAGKLDRFSGLTVDDVYFNSKVVFGFNYADNDLNITHDYDLQGDHGTHVAGIAAANKVDGSDVVGVAPDAQLYIMKVFGAERGGYTPDIVAALEDALILGVDVVNLSLGSPAGFTSGEYTEEGEFLDEFYAAIASTGTILSVSAGNSYTSAYTNTWGTNQNLTIYPDNGIVGSPGTYANTMTVASVENTMVERNYIDADGYPITYLDSSSYGPDPLTSLTDAYEVVAVGGVGEPADYEGLDMSGKVALVSRGVTSFIEKHQAADAAGAIAILVYNNEDGELGMDLTGDTAKIPCVSITKAHGEYLLAALSENPGLKLTFPKAMDFFPNPFAGTMSDFSSWGPAPDLSLAPDITAPGGYIYSTVNDGEYATMSGTSMSAPNIAGMSALVLQYVKETFPAGTDYRKVAQDLLMSTAIPLMNEEMGALYSPRNQGSGVANVFNAITTQAYLTVDGAEMPKVELGDDPGRTGAYSFKFNVTNFGKTNLYYTLDTTVQTEHVDDYGGGLAFMNGKLLTLEAAAV